MKEKLEKSIAKVLSWVEQHQYKAYDPGDGNSSFLHAFTLNNLLLERLLQQAVYRAPFNLRPWIGIRPHVSTKGMGYMAWGYIKMFALTREQRYRDRAVDCLRWLLDNRAPGYSEYCWGNHFPFSSRAGRIPRLEPTIVWTSLIGQAFLDAYEMLDEPRYLEVASSIRDWILKLPRENTESGVCLSYVTFEQSSIHNSNMLGAAFLARTGKLTRHDGALETAREAMTYSCSRQNPDGSWFYGEAAKYHWIDNFHTGYNLDSLKRYMEFSGDRSNEEHLHRGLHYFKGHFFEPNGRPKYYQDRAYPIDIQCAAQAIDTLTFFSDGNAEVLGLAQKVADWTIDNMQAPDGHFYYRDLGWAVNKTPMLHWGQGTMIKALAHLLTRLSRETDPVNAVAVGDGGCENGNGETAQRTLKYALITPARNEEAYIENTIRSVLAQTIRPSKWMIVSDGSTDRTDQIAKTYTARHDWIELLRMPEHRDRQFAAKAHCFNAGYARLNGSDYDVIGNLDADITFDPNYLEFLLARFGANPRLGVAGTPFVEDSERRGKHTYAHPFAQLEHVSGACQLFRRACFEEVGGYVPIKGGAIDWIAVTTARMKGWQTRTFVEMVCFHHRKIGTGNHSPLMVRFHYGRKAYYVGGHPVWESLRGLFQMKERLLLLGGLFYLAGYWWSCVTRLPRPVSRELMAFHRGEQMARLRRLWPRGDRMVAQPPP